MFSALNFLFVTCYSQADETHRWERVQLRNYKPCKHWSTEIALQKLIVAISPIPGENGDHNIDIYWLFFFFASTSTSEGAAIAPRSRSKPSWLQEKTSEPLVALTEEMPKWGTKFPTCYRCENCMSWCSWKDGKLKTEFLQITSNVEHQQVLQALWPVSICIGSGHSTGYFPVHGPGVAPLTSTQGCAEPTAPSCPGMLPALPAPPSSPPPPAIQDQRCSVLPRRWRIWASAEGTWAPSTWSAQNTVPKYCKKRQERKKFKRCRYYSI